MEAFLKYCARFLSEKYNNDFETVKLVFPNNRSILYFNKYLTEFTNKPIWAPQCITISKLFTDKTKLKPCEDLLLVFNLYKSYTKITGSNESFDSFFLWGKTLLSDFDDIDKYMIPAKDLFSNVKDLKELDNEIGGYSKEDEEIIRKFWKNIIDSRDSIEKQSFVKLWENLYEIYLDFKNTLKNEGWAYQGMLYRSVSENPDLKFGNYNYWFIGFNALNKCEKTVMKKMQTLSIANFLWDYDEYFTGNNFHEAGLFLRENLKLFPPPSNFVINSNMKKNGKPEIECVSAVSGISQTKYMSQLLSKWSKEPNFNAERTAIVLADESLLIPVMYAIPHNLGTYNVSMGYPVKLSSAASLLRNLLQLQQQIKSTKNSNRFYHKQVNYILNNSLVRLWINKDKDLDNLITNFINQNMVYISIDEFKTEKLKQIFRISNSSFAELTAYLELIIQNFMLIETDDNLIYREQQFLYHIYQHIIRIHDLVEKHNIPFEDIKSYSKLVEQIINTITIPYEGEPLEGMQVVGFMETRPLDFDRIIMLSLNEGIFPKKTVAPSFIPQNLRIGFGLPSQEYRDAIFAYYFYRLLQRSSKLSILFNSATNDLGGGEPSRFITQLKYEWPFNIDFRNLKRSAHLKPVEDYSIPKTDEIYKQILNVCIGNSKRKLSASSLNQYIKCPMMFYFSTLLDYRETDEVEEDIDQRVFGSIFHEAMQIFYNPVHQKPNNITAKYLQTVLNEKQHESLRRVLKKAFAKVYLKTEEEKFELFGKNILDFEIILKLMLKMIEIDLNYAPFTIWHETKDFYKLKISNTKINEIVIKAYIDRIDFKNNIYRILDYKTGSVKNKAKNIDYLFNHERDSEADAVFQIMLYTILFAEKNNCISNSMPGLVFLKDVLKDNDKYNIEIDKQEINYIDYDLITRFKKNLNELISEILDKSIPFSQTQNLKNCEYCDYRTICKE
ncbi:MAG: PD-(D/E)XK nuclease family protein [Bacteroidales bacterium]|nr:PD-(D/E)XK nuclease family protein [Bacteroidales bacterium]